jgi:hypothetical protein
MNWVYGIALFIWAATTFVSFASILLTAFVGVMVAGVVLLGVGFFIL